MRLHRLEVEGFGPFRTRQVVDFDAFADDGIFLIAGRTGAGKSSILDAVCFGLYGGVPRYEGGEKRLRSDHSEPDDVSEVVVDFSTPAGRFRVTRSPEYLRPAKRGGGMTKQAAAVALDEWTDTGWIGRAARAVDVGNELEEILQLSREQFLQVILLAQNRFSEFLLANSRDRQTLLRRLFGTERFEVVQARFDDRRRATEQSLGLRTATVGARLDEAELLVTTAGLWGDASSTGADSGGAGLADESMFSAAGGVGVQETDARTAGTTAPADERLEALRRARTRADYRAERRIAERADAEEGAAKADERLGALREEQRAQTERDRARAALAALDAEAPRIAAARDELERARAAESLRSVLAAAIRADASRAAAEADATQARSDWDAFGLAVDDLSAWAAERTAEVGAWGRAAELEAQAPALARQIRQAEERVVAATARLEQNDVARAALPEQVAALTDERDEVRRLADRAPDLRAARDAAVARLEAARDAARIQAEQAEADAALTAAMASHAAALTTLAELRRRRAEGMSGELASALVDGEPCPVCGAHEHPAPAVHSDPVSADDVEAADATRAAAEHDQREAEGRAADLRAALAAALARAEERSETQAAEELADAQKALDASTDAARRQKEIDDGIAALAVRIEQSESARAEDASALASAREEQLLLTQRAADAEAAITAARGDFDTVAARIADVRARIAAASALAAAEQELARRTESARLAAEEQHEALLASDFDDPATAELALRSEPAQKDLETRISTHAVQREKERSILFDLELRTLPEEPIDLAPAQEAAAAARAAWTEAVDAASRATSDAERLGGLIEAAAAEHARTASETEDYEILRGLADAIAGRGANTRKMTLETFVLAAELEEIVDAANRRLHDMSAGRYQLRHSDALAARGAASGLGIVVFDAFTGQTRPAQSLSGGETFLSSLALALGLAEVVTSRAGGIRLDTLFIDEGFGSLDADTLDVAMRTLDELRQGGRTVGVISHVEAMQEQIPAQLTVRATSEGPSVIEAR